MAGRGLTLVFFAKKLILDEVRVKTYKDIENTSTGNTTSPKQHFR